MANQNNDNRDRRGFSSMDEDKQRDIASKGGKAAHESGNANQFDSEGGQEAGRKGGQSGGGSNRGGGNQGGGGGNM